MYLSLTTGQIYTIEKDEIKHQDVYQLPLKKRPSVSCNKCYGRGYIGTSKKTKMLTLCNTCMRKCVDTDLIKEQIAQEKESGINDQSKPVVS